MTNHIVNTIFNCLMLSCILFKLIFEENNVKKHLINQIKDFSCQNASLFEIVKRKSKSKSKSSLSQSLESVGLRIWTLLTVLSLLQSYKRLQYLSEDLSSSPTLKSSQSPKVKISLISFSLDIIDSSLVLKLESQ